ncbi:MAG: phage virion morphogenesis protein [Desulfovibrio sp.]|nr:phage virion morphogenesis protein [Desulfovibrio sp.]MBI4960410.1 phage virion morphogenesis protein [Desulfovibrio sp.]
MIQIEVNISGVAAILSRIVTLGANMTPISRALAGVLADIPERAFAEQRDPATGAPWAPLSPVTVNKRGSATPILQMSGHLASSIQTEHGPDFARVTTNVPYAPTHQFGAKKGQYGRTKRGASIPWGDIPGRPFFGVGPADEAEIEQVAREHLQRELGGP